MNNSATAEASYEDVASSDALIQLVTFNILNEEFGLPILEVREIIRMTQVTPVPKAPDFVEGVINLRGQILPVVDLRKRFNLASKPADERTRIVVVEVANSVLGLIVDGVSEVLRIPADTVSPPPSLLANGIGSEYLKGISHHNNQMIILINLSKVFDSKELNTLGGLNE